MIEMNLTNECRPNSSDLISSIRPELILIMHLIRQAARHTRFYRACDRFHSEPPQQKAASAADTNGEVVSRSASLIFRFARTVSGWICTMHEATG
jgi:hypothetical protein